MRAYDYAIIGGGIVGLATALALSRRQPRARLLVLEKERELACHQSGRNSGVIHSGIYYKPGSVKARFARAGNSSMLAFCREHGLRHAQGGKVIVAADPGELARLEYLRARGLENGLEVSRLTPEEVREKEPHVACLGGLFVPTTGVVGYREVCLKYAELIQAAGGTLKTEAAVVRVVKAGAGQVLETAAGDFETRFVLNCAGLQSDRVARLCGVEPGARIVPFRGEYFELRAHRRDLVAGLIYPVPDPSFPFLGVHFTRTIAGQVHAGPNAVLAMAREGYRKAAFNLRDFADTLLYGGFWKMARRHWGAGLAEMYRSLSKRAFVQSLQRLVPEISAADLAPSDAGVRAQALLPDGTLADDFLIVRGPCSLHVCNAPSPAATASLEIGEHIARELLA